MAIWRLVLLALFTLISLEATPIWAKFTFNATGTVGGTAFTNQQVSIVEEGDTGGITNPSTGVFQLNPTVTVIQVTGFSQAIVTDTVYTADRQSVPGLFFGTVGAGDLFEFGNGDSTFTTYAFAGALGPLPDALSDSGSFSSTGINTSIGLIKVSSFGAGGNGTFADSVPEPASFGLALCGLGALGAVVRRRRKSPGLV